MGGLHVHSNNCVAFITVLQYNGNIFFLHMKEFKGHYSFLSLEKTNKTDADQFSNKSLCFML